MIQLSLDGFQVGPIACFQLGQKILQPVSVLERANIKKPGKEYLTNLVKIFVLFFSRFESLLQALRR
jgi:hypothetical protein